MKLTRIVASILGAGLFVACSNDTTVAPRNSELIGDFEDTLWNGNTATVYNLKLKPDSSFFLNVRTLGNGTPQTILGNYKPSGDWKSLKLNAADSTHRFELIIQSSDLLALKTELGEAQLERTTRLLETKNGVLVKERFKPLNSTRAVVYQRNDDGEVLVHKSFITQASPELKALISYYAYRYNTQCAQMNCVLPSALAVDANQLKSTIKLYFPTDTSDAKWLDAPIPFEQKPELHLLYVTANNAGYQVQSVSKSSKGNLVAFTDQWEMSNYKWINSLHTSGPTSMEVILDRDVKIDKPKDGTMIINMKK